MRPRGQGKQRGDQHEYLDVCSTGRRAPRRTSTGYAPGSASRNQPRASDRCRSSHRPCRPTADRANQQRAQHAKRRDTKRQRAPRAGATARRGPAHRRQAAAAAAASSVEARRPRSANDRADGRVFPFSAPPDRQARAGVQARELRRDRRVDARGRVGAILELLLRVRGEHRRRDRTTAVTMRGPPRRRPHGGGRRRETTRGSATRAAHRPDWPGQSAAPAIAHPATGTDRGSSGLEHQLAEAGPGRNHSTATDPLNSVAATIPATPSTGRACRPACSQINRPEGTPPRGSRMSTHGFGRRLRLQPLDIAASGNASASVGNRYDRARPTASRWAPRNNNPSVDDGRTAEQHYRGDGHHVRQNRSRARAGDHAERQSHEPPGQCQPARRAVAACCHDQPATGRPNRDDSPRSLPPAAKPVTRLDRAG